MACEARTARCLYSWDTEYSADSAEFCPIDPYRNYLAVGTYQLAENDKEEKSDATVTTASQENSDPKKRLGRLYLKHFDTNGKKLVLIQQMEMDAILDMKWCQHTLSGNPVLAVANAVGHLVLYKLKAGDGEFLRLTFWCKYEIEEDTLALSLDWSTGKNHDDSPVLTVSDSKGNINIIQITNSELTLLKRFPAHSFEAWISAFDYWHPHIVFSGGDDSKFRKFDIRCDPCQPLHTSKVHNAGVTSIHSSAFSEHLLASGSYDETVNLWDTRKMTSPVSSVSTGGGVWRLKWEPNGKNFLVAACMHNGFHIIENANSDVKVVSSFMEHKSLAYGADWWYNCMENTHFIASASFYDHLLCLWEFTDN